MTSSRPLIIPQKRALLPPKANSRSIQNRTYQVLNPSAVAAEMCMKAPSNPETEDDPGSDQEKNDIPNNPTRIEFNFAASPQPFLDPPTWEAMLKRSRMVTSSSEGYVGDTEGEVGGPSETTEELRTRQQREAEYRSMAIRGRSSISGRGKRGRGTGAARGYWGGRH